MENRKPNWNKWKLIHDAEVWQVIALSLDIDPAKVTRSKQDWMAGSHYVNHEGLIFQDRLDIVKGNFAEIDQKPKHKGSYGSAYCYISIANFAHWAISKEINIPDEMKELAKNPAQQAGELFDPQSQFYPLELDIAYRAWQAATQSMNNKITPKNNIKNWLETNHNSLSTDAKQRIATVANWKKTGGAPKT